MVTNGVAITPSRQTCLELLKRRRVPQHIIVHSLQVERVVRFLAVFLNERGENLDLRLLEAAALLHDITKIDGLRTGRNHARTGAALLRAHGFDRVAEIVEHHIVVPRAPRLFKVTEDELVNYADKRVMHDRIVTLQERFEDIKDRYGNDQQSQAMIGASLERAREIERKIFRNLPMRPAELPLRMRSFPVTLGENQEL